MNILAHRGLWAGDSAKKNTLEAFSEAIAQNFGLEIDVRDYQGDLVVSHDPISAHPKPPEILLLDSLLRTIGSDSVTLAINIKTDGIAEALRKKLASYPNIPYFCFDMSIPETLSYSKQGLPYWMRVSEFESLTPNPLWEKACGFWLDSFDSTWYDEDFIRELGAQKKALAVVSPELHGRKDFEACWNILKKVAPFYQNPLYLCTDFPQESRKFFAR